MTTATATRSSLYVRHICTAIVTGLLAIVRSIAAFTVGVLIAGFVLILSGLVGMFAGYDFDAVVSNSMEPTIMTGDWVVTRPYAEGDLQPGTILSYRMVTPDRTISVTHRVIAVQDGQATMKGDHNEAVDPQIIGTADVLGVVTFRADGAAVRLGIGVYLGAVVLFFVCGFFEKLLSWKRA
jgi:signal peptidase I